MNEEETNDIDASLDALLERTVTGLLARIGSGEANGSDFTAAIKLLGMTGRLETLRDEAERQANESRYGHLPSSIEDLEEYDTTDEAGNVVTIKRKQEQTK